MEVKAHAGGLEEISHLFQFLFIFILLLILILILTSI